MTESRCVLSLLVGEAHQSGAILILIPVEEEVVGKLVMYFYSLFSFSPTDCSSNCGDFCWESLSFCLREEEEEEVGSPRGNRSETSNRNGGSSRMDSSVSISVRDIERVSSYSIFHSLRGYVTIKSEL